MNNELWTAEIHSEALFVVVCGLMCVGFMMQLAREAASCVAPLPAAMGVCGSLHTGMFLVCDC